MSKKSVLSWQINEFLNDLLEFFEDLLEFFENLLEFFFGLSFLKCKKSLVNFLGNLSELSKTRLIIKSKPIKTGW